MNQFVLVGKLQHIHETIIVVDVDNEYLKLEKTEEIKSFFENENVKEGILIGVMGKILESNKLHPIRISFMKGSE